MENTSSLSGSRKVNSSFIILTGLLIAFAFAITLFGTNGLIFSIIAASGLVLVPYLYNKPNFFLFFSLFIYPFSRLLALENKFVITGTLYTLSLPCVLWIMTRYFGRISKTSFYLWGMLGYVTVVFLNILRPDPGLIDIAKEFGRTLYGIFIILAIYNYVENDGDKLKKISRYLSYMLNLIALIGIGQYFTKFGGIVTEGIYRARGTFPNFNELGYVTTLFICMSLYFLLTSETYKQRFYWTATIAINLIALMVTFSKTGIINTAIVFLTMSLFLNWKRKLQLFGSLTLAGAVLATFLTMSGAMNILIIRFLNTTSLEWRFGIWRKLYDLFLQGNHFIGQGANASRNFLRLITVQGESFAPHNVYLETLNNFGIIGMIPFLMIFIFLIYQGLKIYFDRNIVNNQNKIIGVAVLTITFTTMIQNFVSNAFYDRAVNIFFWAILTILVCWYNYYKSVSIVKN